MTIIAHLSDLHFGKTSPEIIEALRSSLHLIQPDLVVISGDLTQRATKKQFIAARQFIDGIPFKKLIVPGNHDVPLYNLFLRFFAPLYRFKKHICSELTPI